MVPTRVWVVGGTSGIGEACAGVIAAGKSEVFVSGIGNDVRCRSELSEFVEDHGPFDGMVYSVGVTQLDWTDGILPSLMSHIYETNVIGLINVLQACPSVKRVVVIGSDAAWRPMRTSVAYCASKAALHAAVACIARERASDDFAINVVAPGMTDNTGMQKYIDDRVPAIRGWTPSQTREYEKSQIPMGRRAEPWEVAEVVRKVLTMETNYLNGAVIAVNGGR